jgi:hypothetical protein
MKWEKITNKNPFEMKNNDVKWEKTKELFSPFPNLVS